MPPRLIPSADQIDRLATPLNHGERRVLDRLVELLNENWSIYVQPHLLNMHPDFLLLSRGHGVTIVEVKDWQDGGHRNHNENLEVRDSHGSWVRTNEDPILQAHHYRSGVSGRFVSTPSQDAFRSVRAVVVLPQWSSDEANELLQGTTRLGDNSKRWIPVVGREFFEGGRQFSERVVWGGNRRGAGLADAMYERLVARLEEPEAIAEQRQPLRLSDGARNLATNPNNATIRRIRGPAGSGKTLGLAARAAQLALEGKSVLVLSFNITLAHYAQDLVRRHARTIGADHRLVDCIHIHGFCKDAAQRVGANLAKEAGDADDYIVRAEDMYRRGDPRLPKYDAILVDEGQDFAQQWWNFLRNYVRKDASCEMVLVSDSTQDIYDRQSWVHEPSMKKCGFRGNWSSLKGCYRLPVDLIPIVSDFATQYINRAVDLPERPADHTGTAAEPTVRRWRNVVGAPNGRIATAVKEEVEALLAAPGLHPADVVILVNEHELGVRIANEFDEIEHIFAVNPEDADAAHQERQERKHRFWPGVASMKGCTVHSYKGWESRAVVVVISGDDGDNQNAATDLAYVALSRVKGDPANRAAFLTVVNSVERVAAFQPNFEREITIAEVPQLGGQGQLGLDP